MREQIYFYELHFFGDGEMVKVSQEQGEKLSMVLMSGSPSKFVMINNDIYQTSSISRLIRKKEYSVQSDSRGINNREPEIRELTQSEKVVREKYNKLVGGFVKKVKLLN